LTTEQTQTSPGVAPSLMEGVTIMAKRVEHIVDLKVVDGRVNGTIVVHHGSLKHTQETTGLETRWTCTFKDVPLHDLGREAAANISVRMANIRELPYKELLEKRRELDGATVAYEDIPSWTTKGARGRKQLRDMSVDELFDKLTPAQLEEIARRQAEK
jgi:hypothetical protein